MFARLYQNLVHVVRHIYVAVTVVPYRVGYDVRGRGTPLPQHVYAVYPIPLPLLLPLLPYP